MPSRGCRVSMSFTLTVVYPPFSTPHRKQGGDTAEGTCPLTSVCSVQLSPSNSDLGLEVPGMCGDGNGRPEKAWERILAACVTEGKLRRVPSLTRVFATVSG